jgi:hypothetical protein
MDSSFGMTQPRLGRTIQEERGYAIAEVLGRDPARNEVTGFVLLGPYASSSIIYSTRHEALEALHDIEERMARGKPGDGASGDGA